MSERRRLSRYHNLRALRAGKLRFNGAVVDCTIRDLSSRGASLEAENVAALPDSFELLCGPDGSSRVCSVTWWKTTQVGVSFIEDL
jgi:hypothetical protein